MEPNEIASQIGSQDFDVCPQCTNTLAVKSADSVTCPNRECQYFNKEYRDTLIATMLPLGAVEGVHDLETLTSWIRLNVTKRRMKKYSLYDAVDDTIARIVAKWDSLRENQGEIDLLEDILFWGHSGYKRNTNDVNERVVSICAKSDKRSRFVEFVAEYFSIDVNYEDVEEPEE